MREHLYELLNLAHTYVSMSTGAPASTLVLVGIGAPSVS